MKKAFLFLSVFFVVALACDLSVTITPPTSPAPLPTNTTIPASGTFTQIPGTLVPAQILVSPTIAPETSAPTTQPTSNTGTAATFGVLSLVVPPSVADGASGIEIPRLDREDAAWFEKTPGHLKVMLGDYYVLQGKFHEPQIYVYPALAYAEMVPAAFESIHRLDNILYGPGGPDINNPLPAVPFFNATQVFASNVQIISFQNGGGVRFLTEYAQYAAPVNNHELFYHFQGVSRDGAYYVIAILPVTAPVLAETSDPGAALPSGGIPYPDIADPNADFPGYYTAVTGLLNSTSSEMFTPTLSHLDALIQSMRIAP